MKFIDENYLLNDETAIRLYYYAKQMPIIDYHCHLSPKEIYEDRRFNNISELWLGSDHYKWRLMRSAGIEERYITGDASDKEKFLAWAKTLSLAIGNPLFEWSHLELKNYFGFDGVLDETTAEEVWDLTSEKLKEVSARSLIRSSNVKVICTTDDVTDDLWYHKEMAKEDLGFKVCPTWRPDRVLYIERADWDVCIGQLEDLSGKHIESFKDLLSVLDERIEYFAQAGCKGADQGLPHIPCETYTEEELEELFRYRRNGGRLDEKQIDQFRMALLCHMMREYHRRGWVAQIHYGVIRNNSTYLMKIFGPDAGGDNIGLSGSIDSLAGFLDELDRTGELPKLILYSLNPNDNTAIDTVIASFQRGPTRSRIQHGSAWWFSDNYDGMRDQMRSLASQGYLAGFVGMLTDSRSFISYARHEYFRRVLCGLLAEYVNAGRFPDDEQKLKKIVEDISYYNVKEYFGF